MTVPPQEPVTTGTHIAVIGAGIIGCCAAYHLLKGGASQITLIDAVEPGGSTTGAGAGFVSHWSAGMLPEVGKEGLCLQQYGLEFYRMLHDLGTEIGYRPTGTLMMALSKEGFERFVQPVLSSPFAPPEMRRLQREEVGAMMGGLVDSREIHAAAYNPHGIQIETDRAIAVLAEQVRDLGGIIRSGTRVLAFQEDDRGVRITTARGELRADLVILAGGAWNNDLLAMIGERLPLLRVVATRIVTDDRSLPSSLPTVQCRELRLWLRETFGAITWGTVQGYAPLYRLAPQGMALAPGQPRLPELLERLIEHQRTSLERVFPPLRGSRIASWTQGLPCYTPDHNLIIGRVPNHPRFLAAGGDNESGVTHGPGLGRMLAEMALRRSPFVDPHRFRLDRFAPDDYPTEASVETALPGFYRTAT